MSRFLDELRGSAVLPIVRGRFSVAQYEGIAGALHDAGLTTMEFTLDGPDALEAIRAVGAALGHSVHLGAGTVRSAGDARAALAAGATFLVSPGYVAGVTEVARAEGVPYLPGVLTPTEIETAREAGIAAVKLFPAGPMGTSYLKAIAAPLADVEFVVTGGVSAQNAAQFLEAGAMAVGIGGALIDPQGDPERVRAQASSLMSSLRGPRRGA